MPKRRSRKRSLFADDPPKQSHTEKQSYGASQEASGEEHLRITAYLTFDQLDRLDRDRILIRRATRRRLDRTALIRGLVEGYRLSGVDLAAQKIATEADLASFVAERLAGEDS